MTDDCIMYHVCQVEALEAQAEVTGELAATSSGSSLAVEDRFRLLEGNSRVDDELEVCYGRCVTA